MSVFSSLQTLAEKYEEARRDVENHVLASAFVELDRASEFKRALLDAWPLLEAAAKALEEIAEVDIDPPATTGLDPGRFYRSVCCDLQAHARAALSSLTGEPR